MSRALFRHLGIRTLLIVGACYVLSKIWTIPYIYTLIGVSVWHFISPLIIDDDDAPLDNLNPNLYRWVPLKELWIKALVLGTLCFLALQFPVIRNWGG